jgi:hypothetical protein
MALQSGCHRFSESICRAFDAQRQVKITQRRVNQWVIKTEFYPTQGENYLTMRSNYPTPGKSMGSED